MRAGRGCGCCDRMSSRGGSEIVFMQIQRYAKNFLHCTALPCPTLHSHCIGLNCIVLSYTALYSTPYCTTPHCTALHCTALSYTALSYTALPCPTLHCTATALDCIVQYCPTLHCILLHTALHFTALRCPYLLGLEVYPVSQVWVAPHAVLDLHSVLSDHLHTHTAHTTHSTWCDRYDMIWYYIRWITDDKIKT